MEALLKYQKWSWLLLLVLIYVFIFLKLDSFHVLLWDESYFAVHATEMVLNDSWLLPYYNGEPINRGTKPPIQYLFQILFIKLIGVNELALRLPSAIAAAASVLIVFHYARSRFNDLVAWISSMVLLTTAAFIHFHTGRGMEADAMLALVMLIQVIVFSQYIKQQSQLTLILFGLTIACGFLVKSIAGFMFVPGFVIYMFIYERERMAGLLRTSGLYIAIVVALGLPMAYIAYRELAFPGFIDFIMERHVGRFSNELGYYQSAHYYIKLFTTPRFLIWTAPALASLYFAFMSKDKLSQEARLVAVIALSYFVLINIANTKYEHYVNPLHPLFAITIGFMGYSIFRQLSLKNTAALLAIVFSIPCYMMFIKSQSNYIEPAGDHDDNSARYLYAISKSGKDVNGLKVLDNGFEAALIFYKHKLASQGQYITINDKSIEAGDRVLTANLEYHEWINNNFYSEKIDQLNTAIVYQINAPKNE